MILNTSGTKPIYIQIAEWIETEILNGNFKADEKVYSQYKLAEMFTINPATAAKGLNVLFDENILYNKRGLGKFVSPGAKEIILNKRKDQTMKGLIRDVVSQSQQLQIKEEELIRMIRHVFEASRGEKK